MSILFRPFGILPPKDFYIILGSNLLIMRPDEGYSRKESCALTYISTLLLTQILQHVFRMLLLTQILQHVFRMLLLTQILQHVFRMLLLPQILQHVFRMLL
jgi:hypothetical protein